MSRLVTLLLLSAALIGCTAPGFNQGTAADSQAHLTPLVTANKAALQLQTTALDPSNVAFRAHTGSAPFDNYLAVNIHFGPIAHLREQLEREIGQTLNHRGEAHITVITPPEYTTLADYVSIDLLNQRYSEFIQYSKFTPICVGRSLASENGMRLETWYLVIESEDLHALRTEVEHLYYERGGPPPAFANPYQPHITIGFSERDLYAQDGVVKDLTSCVYPIKRN